MRLKFLEKNIGAEFYGVLVPVLSKDFRQNHE